MSTIDKLLLYTWMTLAFLYFVVALFTGHLTWFNFIVILGLAIVITRET